MGSRRSRNSIDVATMGMESPVRQQDFLWQPEDSGIVLAIMYAAFPRQQTPACGSPPQFCGGQPKSINSPALLNLTVRAKSLAPDQCPDLDLGLDWMWFVGFGES